MGKKQTGQRLADGTVEALSSGDPNAELDAMLVSSQNFVITQRRGYQQALAHRGEVVHLAHAAGWSKYRIAQRLGITRRAVDEALDRPAARTPEQFLDLAVKRNGGLENPSVRNLRQLLHSSGSGATSVPSDEQ